MAPNTMPRRSVFREEIRNAIKDAIYSGVLKPGDRIIETFWAKEVGVSQGPVREAIRDLEGMGLVETIPFKGSRVREITPKDIKDNYSVRICLESKSISDVITNLYEDELRSLVKQLHTILKLMDKHAKQGNLKSFSEADTLFHKTIILATDNPVLLKLWEECNLGFWVMFSALNTPESLLQLHEGHTELLHAIESRQLQKATTILEGHLTTLMNEFIENK